MNADNHLSLLNIAQDAKKLVVQSIIQAIGVVLLYVVIANGLKTETEQETHEVLDIVRIGKTMTPEDVKEGIRKAKLFAPMIQSEDQNWVDPFKEDLRLQSIRIAKWEFNEFYDGANYTVGEYRFWFKITKGGAVKAGYEHRSPVAGTNQSVPWSYLLGEYKNIKSLEQIDVIFGFASPDYK